MDIAGILIVLTVLFITLAWKNVINGSSKSNASSDDNLQRRAANSIKNVPSPLSLPIIGNSIYMLRTGFCPVKLTMKLFQNFGPIVKINMPFVRLIYLFDPAMLKTLLSSSSPKYMNKYRPIYDSVFEGRMTRGLVSAEYNVWHPHRKVISNSFSYKSLQNHLIVSNKHATQLISDILTSMERNNTGESQTAEGFNPMIYQTIMKIVLDMVVGINSSNYKEWNYFQEQIEILKGIATERVLKPWFLIGPLWRLHPLRKVQLAGIVEVDRMVENQLRSYQEARNEELKANKKLETSGNAEANIENGGRTKCMMEEMITYGLTDEEIQDEIMTTLIAGQDTTGHSLKFLLINLALHQDIQEKCREEVDALFHSKLDNVSDNSFASFMNFSMEDLTQLKYLERCIMENLRVCPPLPFVLRRLDAPIQLSESVAIPEGYSIVVPPWTVHRNPEVFSDPEKFDPDRFLPENVKQRNAYSFLAFSGGPRNCIGWKSAIITMKVVAALILRNFIVETKDTWEKHEITFEVTLTTKRPFNCSLRKRLRNHN